MEGTIYLNKSKKDSQKKNSEEQDQDQKGWENPVVGGVSDEENIREDLQEKIQDEAIEDSEDSSVWEPGFLKIEEEVEKEIASEVEKESVSPENKDINPDENIDKKSIEKETELIEAVEITDFDDEVLNNVSGTFSKYLKKFKHAVVEENRKSSNPIFVDEIASKVAKFYEVIRRVIDWKEEHLIRRTAIERVLKRRFVSKIYGINLMPDINPSAIAEPFVLELVRSGYFPNGKIAKEKIFEVQKVLERYLYILSNATIRNGEGGNKSKREIKAGMKKKINFYNWVIEVAACEIEEVLDAPLREYAMLDLMTECMLERIRIIPDNEISDNEKYVQIYVAVHRTLYNLDAPIITFHLLKHKYPELFKSEEVVPFFTEKVLDVWQEIESDLNYKKSSEFYRVAEKYDAAYLMIGDSMNKFEKDVGLIDGKISDPAILLSIVEESYNGRLTTLKKRLSKLAIFSTLSIFVAGGASLLIFEIPIAKMVRGFFSPWAIVADLAIPTALMFVLVWMIRPPSGNNLEMVKEEVSKIVYKSDEIDVYEIKLRKKVRKLLNFIFAIIYLAGGLVSMYAIYWVFDIAGVPWTSLYINTANVAMVVFAAMVIRQRSKELTIIEKENIIEFILDFFSIPLAKVGSWLSEKWKEYNIVSVFFIALVDFPFSTFVATIEGWRNFIKEKRSEIR